MSFQSESIRFKYFLRLGENFTILKKIHWKINWKINWKIHWKIYWKRCIERYKVTDRCHERKTSGRIANIDHQSLPCRLSLRLERKVRTGMWRSPKWRSCREREREREEWKFDWKSCDHEGITSQELDLFHRFNKKLQITTSSVFEAFLQILVLCVRKISFNIYFFSSFLFEPVKCSYISFQLLFLLLLLLLLNRLHPQTILFRIKQACELVCTSTWVESEKNRKRNFPSELILILIQ